MDIKSDSGVVSDGNVKCYWKLEESSVISGKELGQIVFQCFVESRDCKWHK